MNIEYTRGRLGAAIEGLEEMKGQLADAYRAFEKSYAAANLVRTNFGELVSSVGQSAVDNFISAAGIVNNTVIPELRSANTHFRESGLNAVTDGSAHLATEAPSTASSRFEEFAVKSNEANTISKEHMVPAMNTAFGANEAAQHASDHLILGFDSIWTIERRVTNSIEMLTEYRNTL